MSNQQGAGVAAPAARALNVGRKLVLALWIIIALSALFIARAWRMWGIGSTLGASNDEYADPPVPKIMMDRVRVDPPRTDYVASRNVTNPPPSAGETTIPENETLEFVHITKTGGTSIELAAAAAGVAWSMCKFHPCHPLDEADGGAPLEDEKDWPCSLDTSPWHCPPSRLERSNYGDASLFAVVRNPYDRIISEYYWRNGLRGKPGPNSPVNRPRTLNFWINRELDRVERSGVCTRGHCIPMHEYTHLEGRRVVDHVLRLENIAAELPVLLRKYGLGRIKLGREKEKARREENILNVTHLTKRTICRINEWAKLDFHYFGYEQLDHPGVTRVNGTCI